MAKSKPPRGKGPKASDIAQQQKQERAADSERGESGDPLRAFPADPPPKNLKLLILSAILFTAWFGFLLYVALLG